MTPYQSILKEKQMKQTQVVSSDLPTGESLVTIKAGPHYTAGISGKTEGSLKYDGDKPQMDLVPLSSVYAVAQVLTFGAKKYSADGWKDVPDARKRYTAAMLRHLTLIQEGEEFDEDSGLPHLDHVACNAMFLSWFRRNPTRGLPLDNTGENL